MKASRHIFWLSLAALILGASSLIFVGAYLRSYDPPVVLSIGFLTLGAFVSVILSLRVDQSRLDGSLRQEFEIRANELIVGSIAGKKEAITAVENKLKLLDTKVAPLEKWTSRISSIEKLLHDLVSVPMLWIVGLRDGRPHVQKQILEQIARNVRELSMPDAPQTALNDIGLRDVIRELAEPSLVESPDSKIRELVFMSRDYAYGLPEQRYPLTKAALRDSAETMLGGSAIRMARGYAEVMLNATQWKHSAIRILERRLREVRKEHGFTEQFEKCVKLDARRSVGCDVRAIGNRLWKRVWPTDERSASVGWGSMICSLAGTTPCGCECKLEEISLGGAWCKSCPLISKDEIVQIELHLPSVTGGKLVVEKARFVIHPMHFNHKGERVQDGIGIEFLSMTDDNFSKLAAFVQSRDELVRSNRPAHAP